MIRARKWWLLAGVSIGCVVSGGLALHASAAEPDANAQEKAAAARLVLACGRLERDAEGHIVRAQFVSGDTKESMLVYLRELPHLTKLHLEGSQYTDAAVAHLAELPKLKSLTISAPLTDAAFANLAKLTQLEELYLVNGLFTGEGVAKLDKLQELKFLLLDSKFLFETSPAVVAIKVKLPKTVIGILPIGTRQAIADLKKFGCLVLGDDNGNVHTVRFREAPRATTLALLTGVPEVRTLDFLETATTGATLAGLPPLHALRELDLSYTRVTDRGLRHLHGRKSLRYLLVQGTGVTAEGAADLQKELPELRIYRLGDMRALGEILLDHTEHRKQLIVALINPEVTDARLAKLKDHPDLRRLELRRCEHLTDDGIAVLKWNFRLSELNLAGTKITDAGLDHLRELESLQKVFVGSTPITAEGIARFRKTRPDVEFDTRPLDDQKTLDDFLERKAHIVHNDHGWVQTVHFERGTASNADMALLKGFPFLETVVTWGDSKITDAGVRQLGELKQLRDVDLRSRLITPTAIKHLRAQLPDARIEIDQLLDRKPEKLDDE